jgi:hypothetical protein
MTNNEGVPENDEPGFLTTVGGIVADLATGATVPAPIRRNFFKAIGRLCSAAIEIPAAYLEGIAEEKRAETQGRIKIISTTASQIAENIKVDPEYARVALRKYGERIVREQVNLDSVAEVAAKEIHRKAMSSGGDHETQQEVREISDDWLNLFEKEASQKSSEEMQLLFGRILAGEIQRPSSFSIQTIKLVGQLDSRVAARFRTLCSLTLSLEVGNHIMDARVASLGGNAGQNALQKYGLGFDQLNVLEEFGLIISDFNSYMNYRASVAIDRSVALPFIYQTHPWGLVSSKDEASNLQEELRVHGVALSQSGKELMKIVEQQANDEYTEALKNYFKQLELSMVPISPQAGK